MVQWSIIASVHKVLKALKDSLSWYIQISISSPKYANIWLKKAIADNFEEFYN